MNAFRNGRVRIAMELWAHKDRSNAIKHFANILSIENGFTRGFYAKEEAIIIYGNYRNQFTVHVRVS